MTPNSDDTQVGIAGGDGPKDLRDEITSYFADRGDLVGEQMADLNPDHEDWNLEEHLLIRAYAALSAQGGGSEPVAWRYRSLAWDIVGEPTPWILTKVKPDRELLTCTGGKVVYEPLFAAPQSEAPPVDGVEREELIARLESFPETLAVHIRHHIREMYPAAVEASPSTFLKSVGNTAHNAAATMVSAVLAALPVRSSDVEPVVWGSRNASGDMGEIVRYTREAIEKYIKHWAPGWQPVALYAAPVSSDFIAENAKNSGNAQPQPKAPEGGEGER